MERFLAQFSVLPFLVQIRVPVHLGRPSDDELSQSPQRKRTCLNLQPFPPSPTRPPMPMPVDHLAPSRQGHGRSLNSDLLCPGPINTDGGQTWTDACWGRLELLPPDRRPYILCCRRCSAVYREEDVSQFPRRQGARLGQGPCGGRVRSLSCHL